MALDLNDKTSNGNNLTNNNGVTDVTSSLPSIIGNTDAAGFASASSQNLSAPDSSSFHPTTAYTLECWVKFTTLPANGSSMYIINKSSDNNAGGFYMCVYNNSGVYGFYGDANNAATYSMYYLNPTLSTGVWHHWAITFDGSKGAGLKMEFFLDGVSQGHGTAQFDSVTSIASTTLPFTLGCNIQSDNVTKGAFLNGVLDEVRIWNIVRTATEISNNYNVRLTGSESGLMAYYPFEALPGTVLSSLFMNQAVKRASFY